MSEHANARQPMQGQASFAEAQRRVALCTERKAAALDLGLDLERLPDGLSDLTWLTELRMCGGRITDFSPLAPLRNLELLEIGSLKCPFPGLDFMSGWTSLRSLDIITPSAVDLKPLANCAMLKKLQIWSTQNRVDLLNFDALAGLQAMESLSLNGTQSDRLDIISGWTRLKFVLLVRTNLATLEGFENLTQLEDLYVREASIRDLSPLTYLVALKEVTVTDTPVDDLSPLCGLPLLERLDVSGTRIGDLSPLSALAEHQCEFERKKRATEPFWFSGLQYLRIDRTNVTELAPLPHLQGLRYLYLAETAVASIDPLRACVALRMLDIAKTQVTTLGPRGSFRHLQSLDASDTGIADLQALEPASGLQWLSIAHTEISELTPVRQAYECRALYLRGSQVANLLPIIDTGSRLSQDRGDSREALDFRDTPASRLSERFGELAALANESTYRCFSETKAYLQELTRPKPTAPRRGLFGWFRRRPGQPG